MGDLQEASIRGYHTSRGSNYAVAKTGSNQVCGIDNGTSRSGHFHLKMYMVAVSFGVRCCTKCDVIWKSKVCNQGVWEQFGRNGP